MQGFVKIYSQGIVFNPMYLITNFLDKHVETKEKCSWIKTILHCLYFMNDASLSEPPAYD